MLVFPKKNENGGIRRTQKQEETITKFGENLTNFVSYSRRRNFYGMDLKTFCKKIYVPSFLGGIIKISEY